MVDKQGKLCVKCGAEDFSEEWKAEGYPSRTPEHMLRTCSNCGYAWKVPPRDAAASAPQADPKQPKKEPKK